MVEGELDQRLKYLAELPRGKTAGWFQFSDIFKVKEVVGDTMCIIGGMRNSLLQSGTVEQVRDHTKKVCEVAGKGGGFIMSPGVGEMEGSNPDLVRTWVCLLYTSDAADDLLCVDLGGRRIIKKKKNIQERIIISKKTSERSIHQT